MMQTRIFEWEEYRKPTVQIFSQYEEQKWISKQQNYEIHVTSRKIDEYTIQLMKKWEKKQEARVVWLGVNSSEYWEKILEYRNKMKVNVHFAFYLNSFIGLEENISSTIKQMIMEDAFIFNSKFSKDTFKKTIRRSKEVSYCIDSVSTIKSDKYLENKKHRVLKEEQICIFSRLNPYKNTHDLLETIRDSKWEGKVVVGLLPNKNNVGLYYEEYLKEIARKNNIRLEGMRPYSHVEINKIMSKSLACIILSTSFEETQGKVIVEAAKNYCLPIANIWNGHQDYLPPNYIGNVTTNWDSIRGISIDKEGLSQAIEKVTSLYKSDYNTYADMCSKILEKITTVCSEERKIMHSSQPEKYDYLDYVGHFGKMKINKNRIRNKPPNPNFNIDYYIWKRKTYEVSSINENLNRDYKWLKKHTIYHEYAPLLDLITADCLFGHKWNSDNLLRIIELIESRDVYQEWTRQARILFKL